MGAIQNPDVVQLCPAFPDREALYFKEIFVSDTFKIPEEKPDKEQIVNVNTSVDLVDVQTIEVELPDGETGEKVFTAGNIYLDVQYSSTRETQTVHFVRYQLPFQTYIVTDCGDLITEGELPDDYVVHVCIEKMLEEQIDERTINFELLLLVWVEDATPPVQ
ncbi:SPOCS domain-containing protein [Acetohalobium arabaticum]|uniref:SipL SPOCS domain-containing protein n=1 Tax=Acetohalobium arabaticum (strain ATCC 49924 / DSM 5501 / Z-7288) TaxID=574087 RepID=D9QR76_ACEAZ|nr:SPOCS domain-containing protein [Acetohalobium arabaticum]ADL13017.1 hypothetical protein Acear_1510 [Acetohalobium arabaticum DSM 5501]